MFEWKNNKNKKRGERSSIVVVDNCHEKYFHFLTPLSLSLSLSL